MSNNSELPYPLYDTLNFSDPAKLWTNEKARVHKRNIHKRVDEDIELTGQPSKDVSCAPYVYERVDENTGLTEQPSKDITINPIPGNAANNICTEDMHGYSVKHRSTHMDSKVV